MSVITGPAALAPSKGVRRIKAASENAAALFLSLSVSVRAP